jgi:hypothetical protein
VQYANTECHGLRVFYAQSVVMRCHGSHALHRVGLPWVARAEIPNKYEEVITMRIPTIMRPAVVVTTVGLFAALSMGSAQPVQAADPVVERTTGSASIAERGIMASGAVEDTLKACMARIPGVASAGQRMLAEQSCAGEEELRKTLRSAPKF